MRIFSKKVRGISETDVCSLPGNSTATATDFSRWSRPNARNRKTRLSISSFSSKLSLRSKDTQIPSRLTVPHSEENQNDSQSVVRSDIGHVKAPVPENEKSRPSKTNRFGTIFQSRRKRNVTNELQPHVQEIIPQMVIEPLSRCHQQNLGMTSSASQLPASCGGSGVDLGNGNRASLRPKHPPIAVVEIHRNAPDVPRFIETINAPENDLIKESDDETGTTRSRNTWTADQEEDTLMTTSNKNSTNKSPTKNSIVPVENQRQTAPSEVGAGSQDTNGGISLQILAIYLVLLAMVLYTVVPPIVRAYNFLYSSLVYAVEACLGLYFGMVTRLVETGCTLYRTMQYAIVTLGLLNWAHIIFETVAVLLDPNRPSRVSSSLRSMDAGKDKPIVLPFLSIGSSTKSGIKSDNSSNSNEREMELHVKKPT